MALSSGRLVTSIINPRAGKGEPDCSKTQTTPSRILPDSILPQAPRWDGLSRSRGNITPFVKTLSVVAKIIAFFFPFLCLFRFLVRTLQ